jgi:hypothetical protein
MIFTCTDPRKNEWSDPVFFDFPGMDCSLFWDDDDKVYLTGSHYWVVCAICRTRFFRSTDVSSNRFAQSCLSSRSTSRRASRSLASLSHCELLTSITTYLC